MLDDVIVERKADYRAEYAQIGDGCQGTWRYRGRQGAAFGYQLFNQLALTQAAPAAQPDQHLPHQALLAINDGEVPDALLQH